MKVTSQIKSEKIGTLTEGGGTITLSGDSRLNIGALQYDLEGTSLNVAATLTANTRFQIYAVVSGGAAILVVSQNENSQGPTGYDTWKLVGSYIADGFSAFGDFINIKGKPKTEKECEYLLEVKDQYGTGTDRVSASPVTKKAYYKLDGDHIIMSGAYYHQTTVGIAGSNNYGIPLPSGFNGDGSASKRLSGGNSGSLEGTLTLDLGGAQYRAGVAAFQGIGNDGIGFVLTATEAFAGGPWGSSFVSMANTYLGVAYNGVRVPITNMSNTPIEDL